MKATIDRTAPQARRPAHPRPPSRPLLIASSVALALWVGVLTLIALRVV